jgi:hypothetical protein
MKWNTDCQLKNDDPYNEWGCANLICNRAPSIGNPLWRNCQSTTADLEIFWATSYTGMVFAFLNVTTSDLLETILN